MIESSIFYFRTTIATVVYNGIKYELYSDKTASVVKHIKSKKLTCIIISENIIHQGTEYKVTDIKHGVFSKNTYITSVKIPNSVIKIGEEAFRKCSSLTSITISDGLKEIGNSAFLACKSLTSLTIPNSVKKIGQYAFGFCSSLKHIQLPNGIEIIETGAFTGCSSITSINIPSSVKIIRTGAFCKNSSLVAINVEEGNSIYDSRNNCNAIIKTSTNSLLLGCKNTIIPNDIINIESKAFMGCLDLNNIKIPDSVTSIEAEAFNDCSSLTTIDLPNSVTYIGKSAFADCTSLTSIHLPDNITTIQDYIFKGCTNLSKINIPDSVTSIGEHAFSSCTSIKTINIPHNLEKIKFCAFCKCKALKFITIPKKVREIDSYAFSECHSLTTVHWDSSFLYSVKDESPFERIASFISVFIIGENARSVPKYLCNGMSNLNSLIISKNVVNIGNNAFANCSSLTSINLTENIHSIGNSAFEGCSSLTSIKIPKSVTQIGWNAFTDCFSVKSIEVEDGNCKYDSRENCNAIIETETNVLFRGSQNTIIPETVTDIGRDAFAGCTTLTHINIPNKITSIRGCAFEGCTSLKSIVMPNSVNKLIRYAFRGCSSLTSITLSYNINSIEESTFEGCSSLTSVTIPNKVRIINLSAFKDCISLSQIFLPPSIAYIYGAAFENCSSLKNIEIPENVEQLYTNTFADCNNLESVKLNRFLDYRTNVETVFKNLSNNFKLIVPFDLLEQYKRSSFNIFPIISDESLTARSWEQCLEEWNCKLNKSNISNSSFPPSGICLTVEEYNTFINNQKDISLINGWCESGIFIHEKMLDYNQSLDLNYIGKNTPRKGFYKIVGVSPEKGTLECYYNFRRGRSFNKEIVTIRIQPFHNKVSIGPTYKTITSGDIIKVKDHIKLIDCEFQGEFYKAYCINWDFIHMSNSYRNAYVVEDNKISYKQYGGYNGWDDDTINSAFEGDPTLTWNID